MRILPKKCALKKLFAAPKKSVARGRPPPVSYATDYLLPYTAITPPPEFQWFDGLGCVYNPHGPERSWYDAKNQCESYQTTLVNYINDQNGYHYFKQFITQHGKYRVFQ